MNIKLYKVLKLIISYINKEDIIISNLGDISKNLNSIKDRDLNFYMLGSMGLASSIGLGMALYTNRKVIIIDGDGSLLYNLGSIATFARYKKDNIKWIILDNKAYGSTGFQKNSSAYFDFALMLESLRIWNAYYFETVNDLKNLKEILDYNFFSILTIKIEPHFRKVNSIELTGKEIKERFQKRIK